MASTYSLAITGAPAKSVPQVKTEIIEDAYATPGGMQYAMRLGLQVQTKGPDGLLYNRTLDAERWRSDIPIVKATV